MQKDDLNALLGKLTKKQLDEMIKSLSKSTTSEKGAPKSKYKEDTIPVIHYYDCQLCGSTKSRDVMVTLKTRKGVSITYPGDVHIKIPHCPECKEHFTKMNSELAIEMLLDFIKKSDWRM